jgi:hypothetical protein
MSDPPRLLEHERIGSTKAALLRSLQPPEAAPPAVRAALADQLSGLVAQAAVPAASATVWLKVALVAVAMAGSGAALWRLSREATGPGPQSASNAASASRAVPAPALPASRSVAPAPATAGTVEAPERLRPSAAPSSASERRDKLAEEEALLEEARTLVSLNPARALALLRTHRAQFAAGQLAVERMYLSVDCLRRLGRRAEAEREVAALVARYPKSAYARRAPLLLEAPPR